MYCVIHWKVLLDSEEILRIYPQYSLLFFLFYPYNYRNPNGKHLFAAVVLYRV